MIPLRDNIPSRTTPYVNYAIIAICSLAFLVQYTSADRGNLIAEQLGMVPARMANPDSDIIVNRQVLVETPRGVQKQSIKYQLAPAGVAPWMTFITCMFLHGGIMHFAGNMWFLYVFGDNVEDRLGHVGYGLMYIATGVLASLAHYAQDSASPIPTIGASGAIAGVMGAYALLYPHAKVQALLPLVVIMPTFVLPGPVFLAIWFAIQMYSGIAAQASGAAGGVAWWAHIGGFAAGFIVAIVVGRGPTGKDAVAERRF